MRFFDLLVLRIGKKKFIKECKGWVFETSNRSHELVAGASKRFNETKKEDWVWEKKENQFIRALSSASPIDLHHCTNLQLLHQLNIFVMKRKIRSECGKMKKMARCITL